MVSWIRQEGIVFHSSCVSHNSFTALGKEKEALQAQEATKTEPSVDDAERKTPRTIEQLHAIITGYQELSGVRFEKAEGGKLRYERISPWIVLCWILFTHTTAVFVISDWIYSDSSSKDWIKQRVTKNSPLS